MLNETFCVIFKHRGIGTSELNLFPSKSRAKLKRHDEAPKNPIPPTISLFDITEKEISCALEIHMCDLGCNPLFENVAPLEKRTDQGHGHRHFPTMIPHVIFRTTRKQYQIWRNSAAQNEEDTLLKF